MECVKEVKCCTRERRPDGFLLVVILYILLAIIIGSCWSRPVPFAGPVC